MQAKCESVSQSSIAKSFWKGTKDKESPEDLNQWITEVDGKILYADESVKSLKDVGKRSPPERYFHTKSTRQTMKTKVISGKRFILTRSSGLIG